jgi:hypothetical protein
MQNQVIYGFVMDTKKKALHVFTNGKYMGIAHKNMNGVFKFF